MLIPIGKQLFPISNGMRHKYLTTALVLGRSPLGEANVLVTLLVPELGLIRAHAQGLRQPKAKLAAALATFAESQVMLVRGVEGWRVMSAVLIESHFRNFSRTARLRSVRVTGLFLRLVAGEAHDSMLFLVMREFFVQLQTLEEEEHDALECAAALRILGALGLDVGNLPGGALPYGAEALSEIRSARSSFVSRINHGIEASGL